MPVARLAVSVLISAEMVSKGGLAKASFFDPVTSKTTARGPSMATMVKSQSQNFIFMWFIRIKGIDR